MAFWAVIRESPFNFSEWTVELGGKSPNVIFADAEMEKAIKGSLWAVFSTTGQECVAGSRLFVERHVYHEVLSSLTEQASRLRVNHGFAEKVHIGPVISQQQVDRIVDYIDSGKQAGAELVTGGERLGGDFAKGYFLPPTIFSHERDDLKIIQEEIFGPVAAITPFDSWEELIQRVNVTRYGLAAGIWTQDISKPLVPVLKAERGKREVYTAIFIGLDAIPLDEQVEHRHGVSQAALEISPNPVHHPLEVAYQGQHGEHRFDNHARVPLAPLANPEVFRMPVFLDKAFITEQHHPGSIALGDLLKGAAVVDIGRVDLPIHDQTQMIEHKTQFASDDPTPVRQPFLADLLLAAAFPARVEQFDAIGVDQTNERRVGHKALGPMPVGVEQPKQTCAHGQLWKQLPVVSLQPAIKGAIAHPFEGEQNGNRDYFAGIETGLRMLLRIGHLIIHAAKQVDDKIFGSHEGSLLWSGGLLEQCTS